MKNKLTDRQLSAVGRAARKYVDEKEKIEAIFHQVDAFGYGLEEWQDLIGTFQAGVEWAIRHHKMLGLCRR